MAERGPSLRRVLLGAVLVAVALAWIAAAAVSYLDTRHEVDELLDAHLAQTASLLLAGAGHESDEIELEHTPLLHPYARRVAFQFWEDGVTLRLHSATAPNTRLSERLEGFSDAELDGRRWRVFSAWSPDRKVLIQVGERAAARGEIGGRIARNLMIPLAIALPALGLLVWWLVARALQPLMRLGRQVEARAPNNLAPLDAAGAPAEVAPLVASLNDLFARVRASIENERRFTADAAHELRTPIAALRAQAQVARSEADADRRRHALDQVLAGCDRAAHLVDQLLTLARLEPGVGDAGLAPVDLAGITRDIVAELAPAALGRSIAIEFDGEQPVPMSGNARLLGIAARNLVDNAIRYGVGATLITVQATLDASGAALLSVADNGPGVPAAEREHLGQRFHRGLGSASTGSGLGLSIVGRIAEVHGGTISYGEPDPGSGLRVTVRFPAVQAATGS